MAERRVNLPSFIAGLLALTFAGLYLLDGTINVDEYVIAASALVALGLGGVAASVRSLLHRSNPSSDRP